MVREFSSFRLDLYLIGLLWLKFFNVKFDHLIKKQFSLQTVRDNIDNLLKSINIEKKPDLSKNTYSFLQHWYCETTVCFFHVLVIA